MIEDLEHCAVGMCQVEAAVVGSNPDVALRIFGK